MRPDYRQFVPLNGLSEEALTLAVGQAREVLLEAGQTLFRRGDHDDHSYYLLEGEFALDAGDGSKPLLVRAGSESARHPLARLKPRVYQGVAQCDCRLALFSDSALDSLLTRDQTTSYEVTEYEGDDPSWMFDLMCNPAFSRVPPGNLHTLFGRFATVPVTAGQAVVQQGEAGDYYYLIREGRAEVARAPAGGQRTRLAVIDAGQGFGEEALITGDPRNATVTMLEDGVLMRLAACDFTELLKEPLVREIAPAEASALVRSQHARLIDVRLEDEFRQGSLKGAANIPLYLLRVRADNLPRERPYILFCQTGHRSSTAAFLLAQRGYDVRVLRGGLNSLTKVEST